MKIEAIGLSKHLFGAVARVGLVIAIFSLHALYTQGEFPNLLPVIGESHWVSSRRYQLPWKAAEAVDKERQTSHLIAPSVFPQLYRCAMDISKQPKEDEHMSHLLVAPYRTTVWRYFNRDRCPRRKMNTTILGILRRSGTDVASWLRGIHATHRN